MKEGTYVVTCPAADAASADFSVFSFYNCYKCTYKANFSGMTYPLNIINFNHLKARANCTCKANVT